LLVNIGEIDVLYAALISIVCKKDIFTWPILSK